MSVFPAAKDAERKAPAFGDLLPKKGSRENPERGLLLSQAFRKSESGDLIPRPLVKPVRFAPFGTVAAGQINLSGPRLFGPCFRLSQKGPSDPPPPVPRIGDQRGDLNGDVIAFVKDHPARPDQTDNPPLIFGHPGAIPGIGTDALHPADHGPGGSRIAQVRHQFGRRLDILQSEFPNRQHASSPTSAGSKIVRGVSLKKFLRLKQAVSLCCAPIFRSFRRIAGRTKGTARSLRRAPGGTPFNKPDACHNAAERRQTPTTPSFAARCFPGKACRFPLSSRTCPGEPPAACRGWSPRSRRTGRRGTDSKTRFCSGGSPATSPCNSGACRPVKGRGSRRWRSSEPRRSFPLPFRDGASRPSS